MKAGAEVTLCAQFLLFHLYRSENLIADTLGDFPAVIREYVILPFPAFKRREKFAELLPCDILGYSVLFVYPKILYEFIGTVQVCAMSDKITFIHQSNALVLMFFYSSLSAFQYNSIFRPYIRSFPFFPISPFQIRRTDSILLRQDCFQILPR